MLAWQRNLEKRWTLTKKVSHAKLKHTGWHLGEITVSLRPPSDTTSNVDFDSYDWSKFTPVPIDRATKRLILAFQGTSLVMTPPPNIRGFHPAAGPTKTSPANRPNDIDEPTWSSMADASYQNITIFPHCIGAQYTPSEPQPGVTRKTRIRRARHNLQKLTHRRSRPTSAITPQHIYMSTPATNRHSPHHYTTMG
ncbi:hypothetical protein N7530_004494 [Penicillium desertorum]|uniref:Uncharacterized protein n=1 Tax=Penicillium desertorum TaxID=1303715 RepID=A0A9X0BQG5_9EURO|nr:hypothetical protein N7530_004494 [Penicillium desertorum]